MPAGEGWEGRESLSRQQIESVEEERKEFRALRRWDVRRRHSAAGTLPKVSSRVALLLSSGVGTVPKDPVPEPARLL